MRALGLFREAVQQGQSLQDFQEAFAAYCDLNLHQPVEVFGSTGADDDNVYARMIEFMRGAAGEFLVVVRDARHLGPDIETVARSLVELEGLGSRVACDDEEFPDPLQNAFQTLGVKGVSRTRSRRIRESMRRRAAEGQTLGKPPYGYTIGAEGRLKVVKDEAAVVELVYRLYTKDKLGLRLVAQHLNERGISTRRGGNWNVASVREVLKNPAYTGTSTRFGMRLPRAHEAIIPAEVFRASQETTRARRPLGRVARAEPFLLSRLAYCGYCGNKMMGVTRRQSWKRKDGRRSSATYRYYQCQSRNNQSVCKYHTWRAPLLEGLVLTQLKQAMSARPVNDADGVSARSDQAREAKEARLRNAERRFTQAFRRAARGALEVQALGRYLNELDASRRGLDGDARVGDAVNVLERWESLDIEARRTFLMTHLARIVVRDESVEVVV